MGKGRLQPRDDGDFQTASEYARSEHPAKIMFRCFPSFHGIGHMECHSSFIRFSRCSWWIPHLHLTQSDNPLLHFQYRLINVQKKGGISRWISWIYSFCPYVLWPMATWNWCRSWAAGYVQRTGGEQETDAGEIPGAERWSGDPKLPDVQTSH